MSGLSPAEVGDPGTEQEAANQFLSLYAVGYMDIVLQERFGLKKHLAHRTLITAPNMDEITWLECRVRRGD